LIRENAYSPAIVENIIFCVLIFNALAFQFRIRNA
jgi:hypothetical protein